MLKKEDFTHNTIKVTLSELSALQRIDYLDHLASAEKALPALDDALSESEISRLLLRLDIETGALLVGMSLWHQNRKGPTQDALAADIAQAWPPEAIRAAELMIKRLSGMLPPDNAGQDGAGDEGIGEADPVTAEKPGPAN